MSSFYARGVKVACEALGLIKHADLLTAGRQLVGTMGRGAAKGAITGAVTGGVGGLAAAPEGEGGSGFLRGMAGGALTGGLVGGAHSGLKAKAFQRANPNYISRANQTIERQIGQNLGEVQRITGAPADRAAEVAIGRQAAQNVANPRMKVLSNPAYASGALGGLAGGGAAGLTTEKKSPVDDLRGRLGL
jgi:hypothetical protein